MDVESSPCPFCHARFPIIFLPQHCEECKNQEKEPLESISEGFVCGCCEKQIDMDVLYILDECNHKFHKACLENFFKELKNKGCPVCEMKLSEMDLNVVGKREKVLTMTELRNKRGDVPLQYHGHQMDVPKLVEKLSVLTQDKLATATRLNCNINKLTSLPDCVTKLQNLREIQLDDNQLTEVPQVISKLTLLETLCVSRNKITTLDFWIGKLTNLRYLLIEKNDLKSVPSSVYMLTNLQTIKLQNNPRLPKEFQHNTVWDNVDVCQLFLEKLFKHYGCHGCYEACQYILACCKFKRGDLVVLSKDVIRLIVDILWETRTEDIWMKANLIAMEKSEDPVVFERQVGRWK